MPIPSTKHAIMGYYWQLSVFFIAQPLASASVTIQTSWGGCICAWASVLPSCHLGSPNRPVHKTFAICRIGFSGSFWGIDWKLL